MRLHEFVINVSIFGNFEYFSSVNANILRSMNTEDTLRNFPIVIFQVVTPYGLVISTRRHGVIEDKS